MREIGGERYIPYAEAQEMLGGISRGQAQKIVRRGGIRKVRLSRNTLLCVSDLTAWLEAQPVGIARRGRPRRRLLGGES